MISEYILFTLCRTKSLGDFKKKCQIKTNLHKSCNRINNCEYQEKHNSTNPIVLPVKLTLKAPIPQNGQPHSPRIYEKG